MEGTLFRGVLLVGFLALLSFPTAADITGKPRVIDCDTIEIAGERIWRRFIKRDWV